MYTATIPNGMAPAPGMGDRIAAATGVSEPSEIGTERQEAPDGTRRIPHAGMALAALAVVAVVVALHHARAFIVPLLIGILASYSLRPLVDGLERLRLPRAIGAALVMSMLVAGGVWVAHSLRPEATALIEKLPDAARKLRQNLSESRKSGPSALQSVNEAASELQRVATEAARAPGGRRAVDAAPSASGWLNDYAMAQSAFLVSVAAQTPVVLLLAYFLLVSGDHFRRKLVRIVGPSLSRKKDTLRILEGIETQVQRHLLATILSNVLIGVGTWLAFKAMGLDEAGVWGVCAGVLHFIPYLGSVLLAAAVGVAGFLQFGSLEQAISVAGVALLVASAVSMGFMTWLQSRFSHVNSAVLFIALLFFGWLWGAAGLLLGAPLLAIVKVVCDGVEPLNPVGELLGR